MFHDVTHGARPQRPLRVKGLIVHGNHEDGKFLILCADGFDQVNAVARTAERDIREDDIRMGRADTGEGAGDIRGIATNGQAGFAFQELTQAFAKHRVVVHQENPAFRGGRERINRRSGWAGEFGGFSHGR